MKYIIKKNKLSSFIKPKYDILNEDRVVIYTVDPALISMNQEIRLLRGESKIASIFIDFMKSEFAISFENEVVGVLKSKFSFSTPYIFTFKDEQFLLKRKFFGGTYTVINKDEKEIAKMSKKFWGKLSFSERIKRYFSKERYIIISDTEENQEVFLIIFGMLEIESEKRTKSSSRNRNRTGTPGLINMIRK